MYEAVTGEQQFNTISVVIPPSITYICTMKIEQVFEFVDNKFQH